VKLNGVCMFESGCETERRVKLRGVCEIERSMKLRRVCACLRVAVTLRGV